MNHVLSLDPEAPDEGVTEMVCDYAISAQKNIPACQVGSHGGHVPMDPLQQEPSMEGKAQVLEAESQLPILIPSLTRSSEAVNKSPDLSEPFSSSVKWEIAACRESGFKWKS